MRIALDILGGSVSIGTIIGFFMRRLIKQKSLNHQEYIRQLKAENKELDDERRRIEGR